MSTPVYYLEDKRVYGKDVLAGSWKGMGDDLARSVGLFEPPLAKNKDLAPKQDEEVERELDAINRSCESLADIRLWVFLPFTAKYLPLLMDRLRIINPPLQFVAFGNYLHILLTLPSPSNNLNPYLRRYYRNKKLIGRIPNLIASMYDQAGAWRMFEPPTLMCTLLANMIICQCSPSLGDDRRCCIDANVRKRLQMSVLRDVLPTSNGPAVQELLQLLDLVDSRRDAKLCRTYLIEYRRRLEVEMGARRCTACQSEGARKTCSRCKSVRYCDSECQRRDWRPNHRSQCCQVTF
ncbi:hypothetical protein BC629DRAFT_605746 [Irpex lacteus]|nr:hypothetical protein BC629DRAFT_605746 [Irpex lacteus]